MVSSPFVAVSTIVAALAIAVAVWKAWRTRSVRLQFEQMYAGAHHPSRCLVEVLHSLRSTRTGQLLVVIDVRSGQEATVWLQRPRLRSGDLALLAWMDDTWVLMDSIRPRGTLLAGRDRRLRRPSRAVLDRLRAQPGVVRVAEHLVRADRRSGPRA